MQKVIALNFKVVFLKLIALHLCLSLLRHRRNTSTDTGVLLNKPRVPINVSLMRTGCLPPAHESYFCSFGEVKSEEERMKYWYFLPGILLCCNVRFVCCVREVNGTLWL